MSAQTSVLYIGKEDVKYYEIKSALIKYVREVVIAKSVEMAKDILNRGKFSLVILNLDLSKDNTKILVSEMSAGRPRMKFIALGRAFQQTVDDNLFWAQLGVDGTVTVEDFIKAYAEADSKIFAGKREMIIGTVGIILILFLDSQLTGSVGKFIGNILAATLVIEFAFYLLCSMNIQLKRRKKFFEYSGQTD